MILGVFGLMLAFLSPMQFVLLGWFLEAGPVSHRVHEVSFGLAFALAFVGLIGLVRRPERKPAALWQLVLPVWALVGAFLFVDRLLDPVVLVFLIVPAVLVALYPARGQLRRPPLAPSRLLLVLAAVVAVPLLAFAAAELWVGLSAAAVAPAVIERLPPDATDQEFDAALEDATDSDEELVAARHFGHWSAMGGFALGVTGLAFVGALGLPGWQRPALSAAVAMALYAAVSLSAPLDASAAPPAVAAAAIVWAVAFGAVALTRARRMAATPDPGSPDPGAPVAETAA